MGRSVPGAVSTPHLDHARLECVLRVFLHAFDGGIDRCDFRSARYPQSPVQHWVLRFGLFLIPASFQVVRCIPVLVLWEMLWELPFNSIYSFQTVSYRSFWTHMDSQPLRRRFQNTVFPLLFSPRLRSCHPLRPCFLLRSTGVSLGSS